MSIYAVIIIAVALSMDAFAVSITSGVCIKDIKPSSALKISLSFGTFQMIMPVLGWLIGLSFAKILYSIDHWIAFVILTFLGSKMIYESRKEESECPNFLNNKTLLFLSLATSIDAFAIGITFALLKTYIIFPVLTIGIITFLISFFGVFIGKKFGDKFERNAEIIGGIILIIIGIRILIIHIIDKV